LERIISMPICFGPAITVMHNPAPDGLVVQGLA
jgi:hypothetical protein